MLTNKCMNIEIIPIPCNEEMNHYFNNGKGQFMRGLIPIDCTYNILLISKRKIQLGLVRRAKSRGDQNQVLFLLMKGEATYS